MSVFFPLNSMPAQPNTGNPFVAASALPGSLVHAAPNPLLQMGALQGSPVLGVARCQAINSAPGSPLFRSLSPTPSSLQGSPAKGPEISMANLHVPLDAIKPSEFANITRQKGKCLKRVFKGSGWYGWYISPSKTVEGFLYNKPHVNLCFIYSKCFVK